MLSVCAVEKCLKAYSSVPFVRLLFLQPVIFIVSIHLLLLRFHLKLKLVLTFKMLEGAISYHVFNSQICGDRIFLDPYALEVLYYLSAETKSGTKTTSSSSTSLQDDLLSMAYPASRALGDLPTAVIRQNNDGIQNEG